MASEWYLEHMGKEQGPFSPSQLKKLAQSGRLLPTDLVWRDGDSKRLPASRIKGLFAKPELSAQGPATSQADRKSPQDRSSPPPLPLELSAQVATKSPAPKIAVGILVVSLLVIGGVWFGWSRYFGSRIRQSPTIVADEHASNDVEPNKGVASTGTSSPRSPTTAQSSPASVSESSTGPVASSKAVTQDFSKVNYSPVDFSSLDFSKGPQGEPLEFIYDNKHSTLSGYIPGNAPTPDDLAWRGLRQAALRKAVADKSFVFHGIQITWSKTPRFPSADVEKRTRQSGKSPPAYNNDGGVPYKMWSVWAGKKHGVEKLFDPSGKLLAEGVYVEGVMHGPDRAYWPNGQKRLEQFWFEGKPHGHHTEWHENGKISETSVFVAGKQEGVWTTFFSNGQKKKEAVFADGKVVGKVREWDEKGNDVSVDLSGKLATGNGYTERILSLHPNVLRKFDAFKSINPEGHKARYKPGSVADLLQAMSLLSSGRLAGLPAEPKDRSYGKYLANINNPLIPTILWKQVFVPPNAEPFAGKYNDKMWTFSCTDGDVHMFGFNDDMNHGVRVDCIIWNIDLKEFDGLKSR